MNEGVLAVLVAMTMAVGSLGTLVPVLPGPLLVWVAALVWGLMVGFGVLGAVAMLLITSGLALAFYLGVRIPQRSAAGEGLGIGAQLLAVLLAVVGFFVVPIVGAAIGFAFGVWLSRWWSLRDIAAANSSTGRALRAMLKAAGAQFLCALGMSMTWVVWALIG